ncbi:MAG: hypothetical protein ACYDB4_17510 [Candidatus Dormibacteraceae bacterium]
MDHGICEPTLQISIDGLISPDNEMPGVRLSLCLGQPIFDLSAGGPGEEFLAPVRSPKIGHPPAVGTAVDRAFAETSPGNSCSRHEVDILPST